MKSIYTLLVLVMIVIIGGLGYFWYQTFDFTSFNMGIHIANDKTTYNQLTTENTNLQGEIAKIRSTSQIAKFEIAKAIDSKASNTNWYQRFDKLSAIYRGLSMVNKTSLDITEYYVNNGDFGMNGKIINLNAIYGSGAILDRLRNTGVFDDINSPKNNKQNDAQLYNFEIKGEIKGVNKVS